MKAIDQQMKDLKKEKSAPKSQPNRIGKIKRFRA